MQTIKLDLSCYEVPQSVLAKQADVGRKFQAQLTDRNREFIIPEDAKLSVWYSGTSGAGNYSAIGDRSAFEVNGSTVTVELITQMLAKSGGGMLCLMLNHADGKQIAMWNIPYTVEAVPGIGSAAAQQYFTALSETAGEVAAKAKEAQEAAEEAKSTLQEKLQIGLFSRNAITVNKETNTRTFWEQVSEVYDAMAPESVELLYAVVASPYDAVDANEPYGGAFRVTITKSADPKYGFVEASTYRNDNKSWNAPNLMTRVMYDGKWNDTQWPLKNIYDAVVGELLWTNASVSTAMAPQTIKLPSRAKNYDAFLLMVNLDTSIYHTVSVLINKGAATAANFPACTYGDKTWVNCWRYFFLPSDAESLNISEAYRDGSVSNSRAIPYKIYGIKL